MKLVATAFFMCLITCSANASGWLTSNGSGRITWLNAEGGIVRVTITATDLQNPDSCAVTTGTVIMQDDTKNGDRQYAALLSAFIAERPIKIWINGCYSGWGTTFPKLYSVIVSQ